MFEWIQSSVFVRPDFDFEKVDKKETTKDGEKSGLSKLKVQCRPDSGAAILAIKSILNVDIPISPLQPTESSADKPAVFCTGPNEWLVVLQGPDAGTLRNNLIDDLSLTSVITDISDSSVAIEFKGEDAVEILSEGCGVALRNENLKEGCYFLTNLFHLPVIIQCIEESAGQRFRCYVDRSLCNYFSGWLK